MTLRTLALVMLAACGGARFVPVAPVTVPSSPDTFNKAVAAVVAGGDAIDTKDEAAGVLVTKWTEMDLMGTDYQLRISVTVSGASATVASQCQRRLKDPGPLSAKTWEPCGDRQPRMQQDKIDSIAAALK